MSQDLFSDVQWEPVRAVPPEAAGLAHATHQGVIELLGQRLRIYRLNTGQAILHADDLKAFLAFIGLDGAQPASMQDGPHPALSVSAVRTVCESDTNYTSEVRGVGR